MAFEVVPPGQLCTAEPLPEGQCSIWRDGTLMFHQSDLDLVGVGAYVVVLADTETWRLGLRAVRDGEQPQSVAVTTVLSKRKRRDTQRRSINVSRALRKLSLDASAVAGRYTLTHKGEGKESLLIVHLMPETVGQSGKGKGAK